MIKKKVYRPDQVADIYGVHVRTVYRWISEEKLPAFKIADHGLRIRHEDLDAFEVPCKLFGEIDSYCDN